MKEFVKREIASLESNNVRFEILEALEEIEEIVRDCESSLDGKQLRLKRIM